MELNTNAELTDGCKYVYKERTTEQKKKLLDEKDKTNTQRATTQAVNNFCFFLRKNRLPNIEDITPQQLNDALYEYYPAIRPQKSEQYSTQSMKCRRSALNRYFRKENGFDITKDGQFVKANEMFKAILVEAKKSGKGVRVHTPPPPSQLVIWRG